MNSKDRIKQLEDCLRETWGVMLLADTAISDPRIKAAFLKVHHKCLETGLMHKPGMKFIEPHLQSNGPNARSEPTP